MKLAHSLRVIDHFGITSGFPLDHHPGACHGDSKAFPVIPVESFAKSSAAINTIKVGMVAVPIPPSSCILLSTILWPYTIVKVLCREVG